MSLQRAHTRAGVSVGICAQSCVECDCEGSSMALEIGCRRDLGVVCILIKLYLWILNFEFHIIFMCHKILLFRCLKIFKIYL